MWMSLWISVLSACSSVWLAADSAPVPAGLPSRCLDGGEDQACRVLAWQQVSAGQAVEGFDTAGIACDRGDLAGCEVQGRILLNHHRAGEALQGDAARAQAAWEGVRASCAAGRGLGCLLAGLLQQEVHGAMPGVYRTSYEASCRQEEALGCVLWGRSLVADASEAVQLRGRRELERQCGRGVGRACEDLGDLHGWGQFPDSTAALALRHHHVACGLGSARACGEVARLEGSGASPLAAR